MSFVLRRQPNTRSMDDLVTAACCAVAVGRPEEAAGWRDQAMLIGYKSASQYLDHERADLDLAMMAPSCAPNLTGTSPGLYIFVKCEGRTAGAAFLRIGMIPAKCA